MTREDMIDQLVGLYEDSPEAVDSFIRDWYNYTCPCCGLRTYTDKDLENEIKDIENIEEES